MLAVAGAGRRSAYAVPPWGSASGWAGNLALAGLPCVVPLVALVLALASARPAPPTGATPPGPPVLQRQAGRSTKR